MNVTQRTIWLAVLLSLAGAVACDSGASTGAESGAGGGAGEGSAGRSPEGGADGGVVTSVAGGHDFSKLEDECGLDTGFPGDELCLLPPEPDEGFQLHLGPADYDDPAEINKYIIEGGQEVTSCIWTHTPNEQLVTYYERKIRMRPVSHHMFLFIVREDQKPENLVEGEWTRCGDFLQLSNALGGAEVPIVEYPQGGIWPPELTGAYRALSKKALLRQEMHSVNPTQQQGLREFWTNVYYTDKTQAKKLIQDVFQIAGLNVATPPGARETMTLDLTMNGDATILNLYSHMHAHGERYTAWLVRDGKETLLLEDYNWFEPVVFRYDTITTNTPPDRENEVPGGFSGPVNVRKGDVLRWECEVNNTTEKTLRFDNGVYDAEMCNIFGEYFTDGNTTTNLTNVSFLYGKVTPLD